MKERDGGIRDIISTFLAGGEMIGYFIITTKDEKEIFR